MRLAAGNQANATIGRAVRLAMLNIGGAVPAAGDMATYGTPAKYTFCAAENEAASPWEPLQVELGYARDVSTVSVFGAESMHNMNDHESITGVGLLKMMAGVVAATGANNLVFRRRAGVRVRSRARGDDRQGRLLESGREAISVRARARAAWARCPTKTSSAASASGRCSTASSESGLDRLVPV